MFKDIPVTYGEGTVKVIIDLKALEKLLGMDEFEADSNGIIRLSTSIDHYPDGWFTHNCKYLVGGIKCDLGLKDSCEYTTDDQRCGLIVRRLEVAKHLQSSTPKARNE